MVGHGNTRSEGGCWRWVDGGGWDGGLGTSCYSDPARDLTGILMTQTAWAAPLPPNVNVDFWKAVYQSVDA